MMSIKSPYYQHPVLATEFKRMATSPAIAASGLSALNDGAATTEGAAGNFTSHAMGENFVSFAAAIDDKASTKSNLKHENFSRKHRFQCTFCLGKACSKE